MGGQIARVARIPNCDLCEQPTPAEYDAKTKLGPWAYLCHHHYQLLAQFRQLGTGKGQRLLLEEGS